MAVKKIACDLVVNGNITTTGIIAPGKEGFFKSDGTVVDIEGGLISNATIDKEVTESGVIIREDIVFTNAAGQEVFRIDGSDFLKDGMVQDVEIKNIEQEDGTTVNCLVVTFNTDAGNRVITLPLDQLLNPDDYYTKREVDQRIQDKIDTEIAVIEGQHQLIWNAIDELRDMKADKTMLEWKDE